MKNLKILVVSILVLFFLSMSVVNAQRYGITMDGGRFMWQIEPKNNTSASIVRSNGIYPGDYKEDEGYLNNIGGYHQLFLTDDDDEHPWSLFVSGVSNGIFGGTEDFEQVKYMRYPYPVLTVNGDDAGLFQDPTFIVDPNLECEMKGTNRARSIYGLTAYTTTYTWSHPDYQEIVIEHQQLVNEGYWYQWWVDPVLEDTLSPNHYNAIWMKFGRRYSPGFYSNKFPGGVSEVNWNFWGNGVTDGVTDTTELLMYQWNPDNKETPLEDEGEWHEGDESFYYPYYFGEGFLHADGRLMDDPTIKSPLHWWGIETFPHALRHSDLVSFKAFLQSRYKYGVEPGLFIPENGYGNPHHRNPDGDTENTFLANGYFDTKMEYYFGPFESEVGDTINIWLTHLAGGIEPYEADALGKIWGSKRDTVAYAAGWSEADITWKNNKLRTAGVNDMVDNYQKAREIFANNMKIPKLNLVPPAYINIDIGENSSYIKIEWASVAGAVSYNIYRGNGAIDRLLYDSLNSVGSSTFSYSDASIRENSTYYYYVTAVDEDGIESSHYVVRPNKGVSTFAISEKVIFDVDLTQGSAGGGEVTGGVWENGWKVTEGSDQRIVYDCGYNITNGYIETTFTMGKDPFAAGEKSNYFGAYEDSSLSQGSSGDKVYLRSGKASYDFSRIKAFYKSIILQYASEVWEKNIGSVDDWIVDDTTLHTMRITWRDGTITYEGTGGTVSTFYSDFDSLRYVFIGAGKSYGFGLVGQKFKSIKIVDLGITVSVDNKRNKNIPQKFEISQNYPNPFNPSTTITYALPKAGDVEVSVYNIMGQKVAALVKAHQSAGVKEVTWNAGNLSSGIYFYSVKYGDKVKNMKMLLLK
ncbi:MAG: T9SS type A sorting domain-containing protein [Melioribacteraceae bacterium]|nr:T9SS type A sorting domain-containing protein [Melioribacteraceae bacterium]